MYIDVYIYIYNYTLYIYYICGPYGALLFTLAAIVTAAMAVFTIIAMITTITIN